MKYRIECECGHKGFVWYNSQKEAEVAWYKHRTALIREYKINQYEHASGSLSFRGTKDFKWINHFITY